MCCVVLPGNLGKFMVNFKNVVKQNQTHSVWQVFHTRMCRSNRYCRTDMFCACLQNVTHCIQKLPWNTGAVRKQKCWRSVMQDLSFRLFDWKRINTFNGPTSGRESYRCHSGWNWLGRISPLLSILFNMHLSIWWDPWYFVSGNTSIALSNKRIVNKRYWLRV